MSPENARAVIDRLVDATNRHDLDGVVACFADDYQLVAPTHPARSFRGREQVRRNWTQIFAAVPDIATRLVGTAVDGESVWTEWEMAGTRRDGAPHLMRGVFIFATGGDQILGGRMFLEPVEDGGGDMDAALRRNIGEKP
jgi:ketosteroid isomerase-like protein